MSECETGVFDQTISSYAAEKNAVIVDLRSDTMSRPSKAMKVAMLNADLGDDVYREDPTVKSSQVVSLGINDITYSFVLRPITELEEKAATMLGKEASLFIPSGTMGNLIAIMVHCSERGCEAYAGENSHTILFEQGGAAQIAGVMLRPIPNNTDGTFDLDKLEKMIRTGRDHEPISRLVIVENTINGKVVPQSWIDDLAELTKKYNLKLHMDGARLWNASVASNRPAKDIVAKFDSVTFCLSKGLGAPVGSILSGSKAFVNEARRVRKVLGGGMRQVGMLAAAGIVGMDEIIPLLKEDHRRAFSVMKAINGMGSKAFSVDPNTTQTNMIMVTVNPKIVNPKAFVKRLELVLNDTDDDRVIVRGLAVNESLARFILYYEITDELIQAAIRKIKHVIREFDCAAKI